MKSTLDPISPTDKNSNKTENRQLQDELMEVKIKEAACLSELKETKQKIMELETQVSENVITCSIIFVTPKFYY